MIWDVEFDKIDTVFLRKLVVDKVEERRHIEYKRDLPGDSEADRKKYLRDASSFANSEGGLLIFGVAEESGCPVEICGVRACNPDEEKLRLESMLRDSVTPRIPGVQTKQVEVDGKMVIVMRIPWSWQSPHMVAYKTKQNTRFYSRSSNGKFPLDVDELRSAFVLSESRAEKIARFRAERLARVAVRETPVPLEAKPCTVLHVLPASLADPASQLDLRVLEDPAKAFTMLQPYSAPNGHFCLDGYIRYSPPAKSRTWRYLLVFRNGTLEFASTSCTCDRGFGLRLAGNRIEEDVVENIRAATCFLEAMRVQSPVFASLSLLDAKGLRFDHTLLHRTEDDPDLPMERDNILLADVRLDDLVAPARDVARPILDALWNAAGYSHSRSYDTNERQD